jgi:hypothetical protein
MCHSVVHSCTLGQGLPRRSSLEGPFIVFLGYDASLLQAPQATAKASVPHSNLSLYPSEDTEDVRHWSDGES